MKGLSEYCLWKRTKIEDRDLRLLSRQVLPFRLAYEEICHEKVGQKTVPLVITQRDLNF